MEAKIYNYKTWVDNTDEAYLKKLMSELLKKAGFSIINAIEHSYSPQGYTAVWLLAESHLAIHSFPEANKTYIEISSCNESKNNQFVELLEKHCLVTSEN
jgi:S-adenosylmethionine decarboxylase